MPANSHVKHTNGQKKPLRPRAEGEAKGPTIPTPKREKRPWRKHRKAALAPGQPNANSKLTDALQSELCGLIMNKATLEDAADYLGLNRTTIWEWRDRGRAEPESRYGAFERAVTKALAAAKVHLIHDIATHQSVRGKMFLLCNRYPREYRMHIATEVSGPDGKAIPVEMTRPFVVNVTCSASPDEPEEEIVDGETGEPILDGGEPV
jgi:hypothetical protein